MTFKLKYDFEKRLLLIFIIVLFAILSMVICALKGYIIHYDDLFVWIVVALELILDFKDIKTKLIAKKGENVTGRIVGLTDHYHSRYSNGYRLVVVYNDTMLVTPRVSASQVNRIQSEECTVWVNGDYAYAEEIKYKFNGAGLIFPYK